MTTSTRKLELSKGALSQSVLEAAGSSLQTECSSKYANGIQHGEIAVLSTGNVSCEKIFCGALPRYDKPPDGPENPSQVSIYFVKNVIPYKILHTFRCFASSGD